MRRTKGAFRSEMEGLDVPERRVGDGEGREKREEPNNKGGGGWRKRSCLLNVAVPREQRQKRHLSLSVNH